MIDRINSHTYRTRRVVQYYGSASGWLDEGERTAVELAFAMGAEPPLLDIGVGGGRTVPLLSAFSNEYVGIDYVPEMVAAAHRRFPDADLCVMDARRLDFPDDSFGVAVFTFNGLDSIGERGRSVVLNEVHRVLQPGGLFVFSALNHHGAVDRVLVGSPGRGSWHRPRRLARWSIQLVQTAMNVHRMRPLVREEQDRSVRPVRAHAGGLIGRYTSLGRQCEELARHGFVVEACLDPEGSPARLGGDQSRFAHFHYVARRN